MKTKFIILTLACASLFACKKNGTGGDAEIAAFPRHHGKDIKGATLYIKFKSESQPSDPTNNYDLKIVGSPKENHIHVEGLLPGTYYLYATGFDSTIMLPVTGGIAAKIKHKERKEELDIEVPVTE